MGRIDLNVNDELDKKFKEQVFKRKGMKKGNLTEAVQEAMLLWIDKGDTDKDIKDKGK